MSFNVLGLLGSIVSGGMTGILGVSVQRFADYFNKKQDLKKMQLEFDHQANMKKLDADIMVREYEQQAKIVVAEGEARVAEADAEAFAVSFNQEPKKYSVGTKTGPIANGFLVALDFIRGLVRPGLTIYLCAITTLIYLEAKTIMATVEVFTADQAIDIHNTIVATILYLTTTCVLWWFGTRNKQKPPSPKEN